MYGCCQITLVVEALCWVGDKNKARSRFTARRLSTGVGMGIPLLWHRRHAIMLAGQLPENQADAELVLQAVHELVETFLKGNPAPGQERSDNVLPFAAT